MKLGDERPGERSEWAAHRPATRRTTYRYLLDLDGDLADELDLRMRLVARPAVTAITFEADAGRIMLSDWLAAAAGGHGLLILDGIIAAQIQVGDRISAELVGAGDLIQPIGREDEEIVGCQMAWRALLEARFALLDREFAERVQPWPQITRALLRRVGRRTRDLNVQRAIACQPRLEVRLALLLWHLASRWGKVEPGGVRLQVPLTHQLLGRIVGAERPSVSHALARLSHAGLITGHGDEWHLHGTLHEQLATMIEPAHERVEQLLAAVASRRLL